MSENQQDLKTLWHSASHVMAQAVMRLFPDTKLAIGPSIDNGFYYDFDMTTTITQEILEQIESEMKKIVKENHLIKRFELPRGEALEHVKKQGQSYKTELIEALPEGETISFYEQGEFSDLCAGPHIEKTGAVKAFKLLSCTGAYWRGDSKNKMLQRVYGIAFYSKDELKDYLEKLEIARSSDHNKLGRSLQYFTTVDYIGQGLPVMLPNGAKVLQILQRFVEDEEERRGYLLTKTPLFAKNDLYRISGHWDHYREGMFILGDEESADALALRPMTCPFQFQAYLSRKRSYRDLPMRFNETATLFRNEDSGEMHGLIRVRQFTLSEGHIACTPEQVEDEFKGCIDLFTFILKAVGLQDDVSYRFSKWDPNNKEKYIGSAEEWEKVQSMMKQILDNLGMDYKEADGEAAFYGPKLDVQIKNVFGKEDTLITVQIDFQLASRFGMEYTDSDGEEKFPYIIHRSSIGCYERTLALIIEKYAGALPLWLSPVQIKVLPISDKFFDYSTEVANKLKEKGFRVEFDDRNEKIGFKIREAQNAKVPYMLILGEKEEQSSAVSVRERSAGDTGAVSLDEFIKKITNENKPG